MNKKIPLIIFSLSIIGLLNNTCNKENEMTHGSVEFSLSEINSSLKTENLPDGKENIQWAIVSIENENGEIIKSKERIEAYNTDGDYITKTLSLVPGKYKLTSFILINKENKAIYAAPVQSSPKALLTSNTLPVHFEIKPLVVTNLNTQVVNVSDCNPEEFGYAKSSFNIADTFDFLAGVFVYNDSLKNFELTNASIQVLNNGSEIFTGQLNAFHQTLVLENKFDSLGSTTKITLPDMYADYQINIHKKGYQDFHKTYTKEELKQYCRSIDKGPLVIVLQKERSTIKNGLVAYYPFNGNANDATENQLDGTIFNANLCADRFGNPNSAYYFKGNTDYIDIPNSEKIKCPLPVTVTGWVYFHNLDRNPQIFTSDYVLSRYTGYWIGVCGGKGNKTLGVAYGDAGGDYNGISAEFRRNKVGTTKLKINKWYFFAAVIKGPKDMDIYINGINDGGTYEGSGGPMKYSNNTGSIGRKDCSYNIVPPTYYYLDGKLDEIRVYNRVLTIEEITSLYIE